jgi:RNA ligase (TIGR02306 family)
VSEYHIEVVQIGPVTPHPNADALDITTVHGGYPCVIRRGEFREGDRAVYLPVDSVVPTTHPRFAFLDREGSGKPSRIKAMRLRGEFSMGLLVPADPAWPVGMDVAEVLGVTRYEPPEPVAPGGDDERDPGVMVHYDLEPLRRFGALFVPGEEVIVTEKIHGESWRAFHDGSRLWVGSHGRFKAPGAGNRWWIPARAHELEKGLARHPRVGIHCEVYGYTGGFPYDSPSRAPRIRLFDVMDLHGRRWLNYDEACVVAADLGVPTVPLLYRGPWSTSLLDLANGPSTLNPAHVREGIVVRPVKERYDMTAGRAVLKMQGESFHLRGAKR